MQDCSRRSEVERLKPLSELAVDRRKDFASVIATTLPHAQTRKAGRRSQFPGQGQLVASEPERMLEFRFRGRNRVGATAPQGEFGVDPQDFGKAPRRVAWDVVWQGDAYHSRRRQFGQCS